MPPGSTSQGVTSAVMSNSLTPSARTVGSRTWLPVPSVSAGYSAIVSFIAWDIWSYSAAVIW